MPWNRRSLVFVLGALASFGCDGEGDPDGGGPTDSGGGVDGGGVDAAGRDAGDFDAGDFDAGPGDDGGRPDGGSTDGGDTCADLTLPPLTTEDVPSPSGGWEAPVFLTHAPGSDDLYVVEQPGRIERIAADGSVSTFLDISTAVEYGGERGLLGMAFHPDYATNGRFFLYFTPNRTTPYRSHNHVGEYRRSSPTAGDPAEVRSIATLDDPEGNHNGGMIAFGPDGFLYAGFGDGGGGGDEHGAFGNGLDLDTILGKILRLDVDNEAGMFVAAGNPFIGADGDDRIWAYGLRNPWRFSFDRTTGDLYIGDVGQGQWEEIDFQPASSAGGENYGWRAYEGLEVFNAADVSRVPVHAEPAHVYRHSGGACSVTGGYVYRGSAIGGLGGWYFFADFCTGEVSAFKMCGGEAVGVQSVPSLSGGNISGFGEDDAGELYLVGFDFVQRIVAD